MKHIRLHQPGVFVYSGLHFSPELLADTNLIRHRILLDLNNSGFSIDNFKNATVILDFRCEGQDNALIEKLIEFLRSVGIMQIGVIFNAKVDVTRLDYPAVSIVDHMANHGQWFTKLQQHSLIWETDCDFLCLMRRPSQSRALLGSRLLQEFQSIRMSFGSMCMHSFKQYQPLFPNTELPILLDGYIDNASDLHSDVCNPLFRKCAVNIIVESSAQNEQNIWNSIFITEKTFKAFGMLQIPIWWAVPGLVDCVRNMGYDVFDDIIDHCYDQETDQSTRLDLVIVQLKKLCNYNLEDLRQTLKPRLITNWQRLDHTVSTRSSNISNILKNLNLDTAV